MNAKGQGSFKINPDGSVTHRKVVGYKDNGQRKVITVTAETKTACIKKMRIKEKEWSEEQKKETLNRSSTVIDLCRLHLKYQVAQGELKPKSIDRRETTIENHIEPYPLAYMLLESVTITDIEAHVVTLINDTTLSSSSIVKVIDVLNASFKWAISRKELSYNPVEPVKATLLKRIQKLQQKKASDADVFVLSQEEIRLFEAEASKKDANGDYVYSAGLYGLFLLFTGMRCGEMFALRWADVDLANGLITIEKSCSVAKNRGNGAKHYTIVEGSTKNEKARVIKLLPEAEAILRRLRDISEPCTQNDRIVTTRSGNPYTASSLQQRMKVIFKNAGLSGLTGGLHIFRRTFATTLYDRGVRVKEISAYLGDLESTTSRYYIAARKKITTNGRTEQIVILPTEVKMTDTESD